MAEYKVIGKGFIGGALRTPGDGKGSVRVEKPFKKCPSWLQEIKPESATARKKRLAIEKVAAEEQSAEAKEQQDMKDEISFTDGDQSSSSAVETL